MSGENFDKHFEPCAALNAEGARIGLATCKECGAAILIDPRDKTNYAKKHVEWHAEIDKERGA